MDRHSIPKKGYNTNGKMTQKNILAGIDIGTSKISVLICSVRSENDIQMLGMGTSILKGVQNGMIVDVSLFKNALQNAIKRAQANSDQVIERVLVNIPTGNSRYMVQTGITQVSNRQFNRKKDCELAMQKAVDCIDKKDQSVMHMFPIQQWVDQEGQSPYTNIQVDAGIILGDTQHLNIVFSTIKKMNLKIGGVIHDYLALTSFSRVNEDEGQLMIDFGAQVTSFCIVKKGQLQHAKTISIGSEQITKDISACLKCTISEAERLKVLYGSLDKDNPVQQTEITIQSHQGPRNIKQSILTGIIESRMSQLFQLIGKYLINMSSFSKVYLLGSGSNLSGMDEWVGTKFQRPVHSHRQMKANDMSVNSNYLIAMGQIIYGYRIGLMKSQSSGIIRKISKKIFKN